MIRKKRVLESAKPSSMTAMFHVVLVALALILGSSGTARAETTAAFYYTGGEQTLAIPAGVTAVMVTAVGGKGGGPDENIGAAAGGYGAVVSISVSVLPNSMLYVEVAGNGAKESGFNGGGAPGLYAGRGGGASDVRTCSKFAGTCPGGGTSLDSRLLVAAGGGGGGSYGAGVSGGTGGGAGRPGETGPSSPVGAKNGGEGGGAGTIGHGGLGGAVGSGGTNEGLTPGFSGSLGSGGGGSAECSICHYEGGGGGGGGLYGGGGGGSGSCGSNNQDCRGGSGGGGGGSSLVPPGGTFAMDTTGVPMIQITVPTPVKEEPTKEDSTKEESPAKTPSTSPTTLTQPVAASLIPTTVPGPTLTPAPIKHELSKAQLLARKLAKCKKVKNKRKRGKCVAAAKKRHSLKEK
jgi:hypothetical protein